MSSVKKEKREKILKRDNYQCQACYDTEHLTIHHIIYRSQGGGDEDENLITLCETCHGDVHGFDFNRPSIGAFKKYVLHDDARYRMCGDCGNRYKMRLMKWKGYFQCTDCHYQQIGLL